MVVGRWRLGACGFTRVGFLRHKTTPPSRGYGVVLLVLVFYLKVPHHRTLSIWLEFGLTFKVGFGVCIK